MLMVFMRGALVILIGVYLLALLLAFLFSEQLIFQPQRAGYRDNAAILKLASSDGAKISATYLPNSDATFTVLFSHGNAEDIGDDQPLLVRMRSAGFAVFAYDYQGYGTSEGKATERHVYDDEEAAYMFLVQTMNIQPSKIIVFGRSVGSGPAVDLASRHPVAGLILESGFTSAFRVITRIAIFPFDRFDNLHKIKKVHCPVLIIHGTEDTVVDIFHGRELFAAANEPKSALWVEGANHNDVASVAGVRYEDALKTFATAIQRSHPEIR